MKLTEELLNAMGFIKTDRSWSDSYCKIYQDQLPETLLEFKNMLTGIAHNKGLAKGKLLVIDTVLDKTKQA